MEEKILKIIELLKKENKTISTMESCTGGGMANVLTNVSGSSEIFNTGIVTYSTEAKIKFGVSEKIIEKFSVYSKEVAENMAKASTLLAKSDYGIGITGQIGRMDPNNKNTNSRFAYYSIYNVTKDKYHTFYLELKENSREENKKVIINEIIKKLLIIIE